MVHVGAASLVLRMIIRRDTCLSFTPTHSHSQAAVLVIRGLATGTIAPHRYVKLILDEIRMALLIATIIVSVGFIRVLVFGYGALAAVAIGLSLFIIVAVSVVLGACLPLLFHRIRLDPSHAGPTIQVRD